MPFAVLCQIVCLNLVYFTFLVLDVLSAEIFISLPLRSCAFPLFCEKMCWPAVCIWVIVFILITWVPVERALVVWPVLCLTISCLAFIHSLSPKKFLHWSPRMSLDTIWSWNLHAKCRLLKGGVEIIRINKHTLLPSAKISISASLQDTGEKAQVHSCYCLDLISKNKPLTQTYTHIPYYR